MVSQHKTPGVYIIEQDGLPSVVKAPTGVPAFLGYTEKALLGKATVTNTPTHVCSLDEYAEYFGRGCAPQVSAIEDQDILSFEWVETTRFNLYNAMRLFFDNGGKDCWVVSVGDYGTAQAPRVKAGADFTNGLEALIDVPGPAMIVIPDAVLLPSEEYTALTRASLAHCTDLQSRIALFDVYDGDQARTGNKLDIISGDTGFWTVIDSDDPSYGAAYYPWLHTSVISRAEIDFTVITSETREVLQTAVKACPDVDATKPADKGLLNQLVAKDLKPEDVKATHEALFMLSRTYRAAVAGLLKTLNVMPPSGAMAGVIARTDASRGVWKAPDNTGVVSAVAACVDISDAEHEELNMPLNGIALNTIRIIAGRGLVVWGAHTLDGYSQDWRHINIRRTMIFLEQSIKTAVKAFQFELNTSSTWIAVANMIQDFLNTQWITGCLVGATPDEAYDVSVGLGSTMTDEDILIGYMNVKVMVAVTRYGELHEITFRQKLQSS